MGWQRLHRRGAWRSIGSRGVLLGPICSCCPSMWGRGSLLPGGHAGGSVGPARRPAEGGVLPVGLQPGGGARVRDGERAVESPGPGAVLDEQSNCLLPALCALRSRAPWTGSHGSRLTHTGPGHSLRCDRCSAVSSDRTVRNQVPNPAACWLTALPCPLAISSVPWCWMSLSSAPQVQALARLLWKVEPELRTPHKWSRWERFREDQKPMALEPQQGPAFISGP